jgi:hypothetical protein
MCQLLELVDHKERFLFFHVLFTFTFLLFSSLLSLTGSAMSNIRQVGQCGSFSKAASQSIRHQTFQNCNPSCRHESYITGTKCKR